MERAEPRAPSLAEIAERIARDKAEREQKGPELQDATRSHEGPAEAVGAAAGGQDCEAWREPGDQGAGSGQPEQPGRQAEQIDQGEQAEPLAPDVVDIAVGRTMVTMGLDEPAVVSPRSLVPEPGGDVAPGGSKVESETDLDDIPF